MDLAKPLPEALAARYRDWRRTTFEASRDRYVRLAGQGQAPQVMIISCCDSRVLVSEMFQAEAGDYFVHRNIAALVPPHRAPGGFHGTLSTIEYAVRTLDVNHVLVVGHSGCGGVAGCYALCTGGAPDLEAETSYVGTWLRLLAPCYEKVAHIRDRAGRLAALEHEGVLLSLRNLMTLPFVREAVEAGRLDLHGAWKNIGGHELEIFEPGRGFVPLAA
jgi:carbonic anhydrase